MLRLVHILNPFYILGATMDRSFIQKELLDTHSRLLLLIKLFILVVLIRSEDVIPKPFKLFYFLDEEILVYFCRNTDDYNIGLER